MNRAVFLDRDGVLNRIVWRDGKAASPRTVEELIVEPDAPAALAAMKAAGFKLFVVTNQPDVRRGLMEATALDAIHTALLTLKEGFEGQVSGDNVEVAVVGTGGDRSFRVLTPSEVNDYLAEVD